MDYLLVFIPAILLSYFAELNLKHRRTGLFVILSVLAVLVLCILPGFRDKQIGYDTVYYPREAWLFVVHHQKGTSYLSFRLEPLYVGLAWLSRWIYNDFHTFLFLTHLIIVGSFYIGFVKMRHYAPIWMMMFLFCFLFYNISINVSRQSLAVSICFLGYTYLERRRLKTFCIYVFIAFLFHKAAILALILIPIMYMPAKYNKFMIIGAILMFVFYSFVLSNLTSVSGFERFARYQIGGGEARGTFSITEFILRTIFILIIYFCVQNKKDSASQNLLTMAVVEIILNVFQLKSAFLGRMGYFMYVLYFFYLPFAISSFKDQFARVLTRTIVLSLCVFSWFYVYILHSAGQTYPYHSKILESIDWTFI